VWVKLVAEVLVVELSPKFQKRFVITPTELSMNVTARGRVPAKGVAVNAGVGAGGITVVIAVGELLPRLGSGVRAEAVTTLVRMLGATVVTTMVAVARVLFVIVPRLQVTTPLILVQFPLVLTAETKFAPDGNGSVKTTSDEVLGPRLVTEIV